MSQATLISEIRKRLGSSHALLILRAQCREIPVAEWNAAFVAAQ